VAAIFSYVLLGAGFFATQKAQEVTYAAIKQTTSNAVIGGSLYANITNTSNPNNNLTGFMFNVRIPLGGETMDMSKTEFIFASSTSPAVRYLNLTASPQSNKVQAGRFTYSANPYTITGYYPDSDGTISVTTLAAGQFATYTLSLKGTTGDDGSIGAGGWFTMEMRPSIGAATLLSKNIRSGLKDSEII
jgi:flagellin FlaB